MGRADSRPARPTGRITEANPDPAAVSVLARWVEAADVMVAAARGRGDGRSASVELVVGEAGDGFGAGTGVEAKSVRG